MRGKHSPASSSWRHHKACVPSIYMMAAVVWILTFSPLVQSREDFYGYVVVHQTLNEFNLFTDRHDEVFDVLHEVAANAEPILKCRNNSYLGAKDLFGAASIKESPPSRFIELPLRGETVEDRCTLAFSHSDMQLVAFKNNQDQWHTFEGYQRMFPGAIVINDEPDENGEKWGPDYASLIGGYKQLPTGPLGKGSLLEAQSGLARHRQRVTPTAQLKLNLVKPMVMFSESLRLKPIRNAFSGETWETESYLTEMEAGLVVHWEEMSWLVYKWCKTGADWPGDDTTKKIREDTGIVTTEQAFDSLDLMRRPKALRVGYP